MVTYRCSPPKASPPGRGPGPGGGLWRITDASGSPEPFQLSLQLGAALNPVVNDEDYVARSGRSRGQPLTWTRTVTQEELERHRATADAVFPRVGRRVAGGS